MAVKTYSYARDGETRLSANFKVEEFASYNKSTSPKSLYTDVVLIDNNLVTLLQAIRDRFGVVGINCAYRCPKYNAAVGGASGSQHLLGTAADIQVYGATPLEVARFAEAYMPKTGGIGLYNGFTHVDVRTNRSRWNSTSGTEKSVSGFPGYITPVAEATAETKEEDGDMTQDVYNSMFKTAMTAYRAELQDNDRHDYSKEATEWAKSAGLLQGGGELADGSTIYMHQDFMTREQFFTVMYRFAQMLGLA